MILYYLKSGYRNLIHERRHSLIKILGLSLASAVCLIILLYINNETGYDRFHHNSDRIYRTNGFLEFGGDLRYFDAFPPVLATVANTEIPGIEDGVAISEGTEIVKTGTDFNEVQSVYSNDQIFRIFDFKLLAGKKDTELLSPGSVVISKRVAQKYFDRLDVIGETVLLHSEQEDRPVIISGVFDNLPSNSTFQMDLILSMEWKYSARVMTSWEIACSGVYFLLDKHADPLKTESEVMGIVQKHCGSAFYKRVTLQPFESLYMTLSNPRNHPTVVQPTGLFILAGIGILILISASANFTLLAIGGSIQRLKELGVRKVLGSDRKQMIAQIYIENLVIVLVSLVIGVGLCELLLPTFNNLAERSLDLVLNLRTLSMIAGFGLIISILTGFYPALALSKLTPVKAFQGDFRTGGRKQLRRGLTFAQFGLSIFLISITLIMGSQLKYIRKFNLGFDSSLLLELPEVPHNLAKKALYRQLRQSIHDDPGVLDVTASSNRFGDKEWHADKMASGPLKDQDVVYLTADYNYFETIGIPLVSGRTFSRDHGSDEKMAVLINQAMLTALGWEEAIGKSVPGIPRPNEVIGVISDFHFDHLRNEIQPLVVNLNYWMMLPPEFDDRFVGYNEHFTLRMSGKDLSGALSRIGELWNKSFPEITFSYHFVDDSVSRQYQADQRWQTIIILSSVLAVVIAMLGLYGIITLEVGQRTKEVGIRKVLGATDFEVIRLFSKEVVFLIFSATVFAWPLAYIAISNWLQQFAYATAVNPAWLALSTCIVLSLSLGIVFTLSNYIVRMNPTEILRTE